MKLTRHATNIKHFDKSDYYTFTREANRVNETSTNQL